MLRKDRNVKYSLFAFFIFCFVGYLFGFFYDDFKFCEENFGSIEEKRLMFFILISIDVFKSWFKCISVIIIEFLDDGYGMYREG